MVRFLIGLFRGAVGARLRRPEHVRAAAQWQGGSRRAAAAGLGGDAAWRRPARRCTPVAISPADYQEFEQLLQAIQAAGSAHDLNALRPMVTPEMLSYFAEQLAEQTSRGVRNVVTDVRLLQGDLAQAWAEQGRDTPPWR